MPIEHNFALTWMHRLITLTRLPWQGLSEQGTLRRSLWRGHSDKVALTRSLCDGHSVMVTLTRVLWKLALSLSPWQGRSGKVASKISLWYSHSDRLYWQVSLTSTSYSSNKPSANCVWPTLTTYCTSNPGMPVVRNRIWDESSLQSIPQPFQASTVVIWRPNAQSTWSTTHGNICRPTLDQMRYCLNELLYQLPFTAEPHCKSPWYRTTRSIMMLYFLQCNISIITHQFCSHTYQVSGSCLWCTSGNIWLNMWEYTIRNCLCPFELNGSEDHTVLYHDTPVW